MKKKILLIAIIFASCFAGGARAQISVQFNLGLQPLWGPTGYDYAQYYYIPDIDAYYDVSNRDYVYNEGGRWVTTTYLPARYRNFDLYSAHKVVINSPSPWMYHDRYRNQYASYRGRHDQQVIRDARDRKYWANPSHPQHKNWRNDQYGRGYEKSKEWQGYRKNDNRRGNDRKDNGRGHGRGHDKH